jgi:hypothetical protein
MAKKDCKEKVETNLLGSLSVWISLRENGRKKSLAVCEDMQTEREIQRGQEANRK